MTVGVDRDVIRFRARRMFDDARLGKTRQDKPPDTHCVGTPDGRVVPAGRAR